MGRGPDGGPSRRALTRVQSGFRAETPPTTADRILELGPEGGEAGGLLVAFSTPEQVAAKEGSYTGRFLADGIVEPAGSKKAAKRRPRKKLAAAV